MLKALWGRGGATGITSLSNIADETFTGSGSPG